MVKCGRTVASIFSPFSPSMRKQISVFPKTSNYIWTSVNTLYLIYKHCCRTNNVIIYDYDLWHLYDFQLCCLFRGSCWRSNVLSGRRSSSRPWGRARWSCLTPTPRTTDLTFIHTSVCWRTGSMLTSWCRYNTPLKSRIKQRPSLSWCLLYFTTTYKDAKMCSDVTAQFPWCLLDVTVV